MHIPRRTFLKMSALGSAGLLLPGMRPFTGDELLQLSGTLLQQWGAGLLSLQVKQPGMQGILCPACGAIHGRCGDAVFPLLYLADKTKDQQYLDAAIHLYNWMEEHVSMPDGSWVNEVSVSDWKGTTVFGATALAEALIHFEQLLDSNTRNKWRTRLLQSGEYLYKNFTINTGNINYPIAGSYALCLIGNFLGQPRFSEKGRALAHQCLQFITQRDHLIYGEGKPTPPVSAKGCYSVDLGYNVEESLPALVLYGKLANDTEVLDIVTQSLRSHLEFMLPDGAWDNSWGTRNFKWTYWGSRTSDGCQPAFALMADREPAFYKAALQNTRLLAQCTHNNLLYGGPHYVSHGIPPCVSHTIAHSKALATLLVKAKPFPVQHIVLPRERAYGVKAFPDIHTWLVAKGKWRGTVTGYDVEYNMKAGHASGGALTMLWHQDTGPLITASMSRYQLVENFNMQRDKDPHSICLTPRFEKDGAWMNILDLRADIDHKVTGDSVTFIATSRLVDELQVPAPGLTGSSTIEYTFRDNAFFIHASHHDPLQYILPVIATVAETARIISDNKLEIKKANGNVYIETNVPFLIAGGVNERVFNFVPGMEAIPLVMAGNDIEIKIYVA